jgi:rod shape-determining protein MreC
VERLRAERARAARLETALSATRARDADRERLAALLNARRPQRRLVVSAAISAEGAAASPRTAVLAAGRDDGVRPGMPVIAAAGLVGRITDVGTRRSRVLLLSDPLSRVPVRVQRTGWAGLLVGTGGPRPEFAFDVQSAVDRLRPGDRLVTTGDGGLFPPDVPVAVVVEPGPPARTRLTAPTLGLGMVSVEAPYMTPPAPLPVPAAVPEADRVVEPVAVAGGAVAPAVAAGPVRPGIPDAPPAAGVERARPSAPAAQPAGQ